MKKVLNLLNNRNWLGLLFMLPAATLLLLFLTYPLGLGVWLGFTDTRIGRIGEWVGLDNYAYLVGNPLTQLFCLIPYSTQSSPVL